MKSGGRLLKIWLLLALCFTITNYIGIGCSPTNFQTPRSPAALSNIESEPPYCDLEHDHTGGLVVTGTAKFQSRAFFASMPFVDINACGLGSDAITHPNYPASERTIQYAEIQVLDESGNIVQCGETDGTGAFKSLSGNLGLTVPRNRSLTFKINSRARNKHVQVSVLDTPTKNSPYSLTVTVNTGPGVEPRPAGNIIAPASSADLRGGAFNIYNNILRANQSLRFHTCGDIQKPYTNLNCFAFSATGDDVAPRSIVYWAKGVNPYVYFGGDPESGISFYIPGTDKIYILGGINGDVDSSDTDHFDDAVISHEYGHFLEDKFAKTNSPGGSHDGNRVLDARLVWSEGWANFLSSAVRVDKFYRDTFGNISVTARCSFNYDIDLNKQGNSSYDIPQSVNEGNFREFAIARALWDSIDVVDAPTGVVPLTGYAGSNGAALKDDNTSDNNKNSLGVFWNAFKDLNDSSLHFRSMGLFLTAPRVPANVSTESSFTFQKMSNTNGDYGKLLTTTAVVKCPAIQITPKDPKTNVIFNGALICTAGSHHSWCSDQFHSNDFYTVNHDGTISTIEIKRTSGNAELDLYLYKENYTFERVSSDALVMNDNLMSAGGNPKSKTISLSGLHPGIYMLNISAFENNQPATSEYQLYVNGALICP
ncbi:MAG: hypothetical protein SGI74_02050 [Oligoflexia bacterium]|nr:hypothetical protein [Oligoflexia bacterium]